MKTAAPSLDPDLAQARLDDYVRGALDDDAAADYEADLFERALAGQAPEAAFRTHLGAALRPRTPATASASPPGRPTASPTARCGACSCA